MRRTTVLLFLALAAFCMAAPAALADGWAPGTKASNTGSIVNTRHNMTVSYNPGMDPESPFIPHNFYGEVCVYCHTPHGANSTIDAPLWNRTNPGNSYNLYNIPLTSGQSPTQPGINSLTCLSCHDGTVAIDSIINMPGSGRYNAAKETTFDGWDDAWLSTWPGSSGGHGGLWTDYAGCNTCHGSGFGDFAFTVFAIGTDLRDDHPVGVELPDTNTYDFNAPTATDGSLKFFDLDADGRADSNEVRFYDSGG
ncbi:MAG: cytochrome c3 family protein, partial [Candidatus Nitrospinota bacterium M3_3B_026]